MLRHCWVKVLLTAAAVASSALFLSGCGEFVPAYMKPLSAETQALLAKKGMDEDAPILIRIFKQESVLEIWKEEGDGRFHLFKTYPICYFSGTLGPKTRAGDRQAPEGFYMVTPRQMNPFSREHLAFNVGYPNAYDRSFGRTGDDIMVHGGCRSIGCFAMTNGVVQEIYELARDAFAGGQRAFQIQSFPFRMTAANMAKHRKSKWYPFWKNLKQGYDYFNITHLPPKIAVCDHRYLINTAFLNPDTDPNPSGACPAYRHLPVIPYNQPLVASNEHQSGLMDAALKFRTIEPDRKPVPPPAPLGAQLDLTFGPKKTEKPVFTLGSATPRLAEH